MNARGRPYLGNGVEACDGELSRLASRDSASGMSSHSESLDDFPAALRDDTVYPWEIEDVLWPFGADQGIPLRQFNSQELLRKRKIVERKNGALGHYFDSLLAAIDAVLTERQGE